jgi:hypothetical protein
MQRSPEPSGTVWLGVRQNGHAKGRVSGIMLVGNGVEWAMRGPMPVCPQVWVKLYWKDIVPGCFVEYWRWLI